MSYRVPTVLTIVLLALAAGGFAAPAAETEEPNLAANPGFEDGAEKWSVPQTYGVVDDTAHQGKRSLRVVNGSPEAYLLASQKIDFRPGAQYRFSAWIKTLSVQGNDSGATVCMEWTGAKGWLGGSYPSGKKGTEDWFHVEGITAPIPRDAVSLNVTLYLRRGMTGTAWFDDVRVEEYYPPPLDLALLWPNYRAELRAEERDQRFLVRAKVAERMRGGGAPERMTLVCSLLQGEKVLRETRLKKPTAGYHDVAIDARKLPAGEYRVRAALVGPDGKPSGARELAVSKLAPGAPEPRVRIDAHNRVLIEGKPFFPLGWYFGPGPTTPGFETHFDRLAAGPFNTIMCYGVNDGGIEKVRAYLDALAQRNLKIIYSIKDVYEGTQWYRSPVLGFEGEDAIVRGVVGAFKSHPAILGWYLNDELALTMRDRLEARCELVRGLDPDHPTWSVLYQVDELFGYLGTADVLGTDPYPIPEKPVTMAGAWTRKSCGISGGMRPVWQVPQAFDWGNYRKSDAEACRPPTLGEEMVMTYLCLIHGANGLIYYSYSDLLRDKAGFDKRWADMVVVGNEVKALFPALLSAAPAPKLRVRPLNDSVEYAVRASDDGTRYVLMANPDPIHAAHVRVEVPRGAVLSFLREGETTPFNGGRKGGWCEVAVPPMSGCTLVVGK